KITSLCLTASLALGLMTSCTFSEYNTNKLYSEIMDDAITDKDDIVYKDDGIFMRVCAGFVSALDDGDTDVIESLCSDKLLDMEGTYDLIEEMVDGFEGDVIDTSVLPTDLASRTYSHWSKTDPIDFYDHEFYIYTTDQTYWVTLSLYSIVGDDDYIGLNRIRILTIDKTFNMDISPAEEENVDRYDFEDGTSAEMLLDDSCGILVCYGDSSDYIAVNIGVGTAFKVYKLTGGGDVLSRDDIDDVDWTDEEEAYKFLEDVEPYAFGEDSVVTGFYKSARFYYIEDSDEMLYVNITGDGEPQKVTFASIFDPTKPYSKDDAEVLHKSTDN
nr:hypothetical protein [Saccharofermentans sp.]